MIALGPYRFSTTDAAKTVHHLADLWEMLTEGRDADVIAHAIADALLGAAGLGDIGIHYPDTDPAWKGADSLMLLRDVVVKVRGEGWGISNVDCSIVCESPKIAPVRAEMETNLSAAVGAPVSVKGRRAEGLGAIGRGEGIMCFASTVLVRA